MNLPREERFKPENLIIAGIIPGPKEPKHHINSFLQPMILLICGMELSWTQNSLGTGEMFRAAILSLSSDIPATRKWGGFVGHTAKKGESKKMGTNHITAFHLHFFWLILILDKNNCLTIKLRHFTGQLKV